MKPKGPDQAIPKSQFRSATDKLREIQQDIPRGNLGKSLSKIEKGDIGTENPTEESIEKLKLEINGLVAFSLQEIWNGISRDKQEDSFQSFEQSVLSFNEELKSKIELFFFKNQPSTRNVLEFLKDVTQQKLNQHVIDWYKFHQQRLSNRTQAELDMSDRAFERYEFVLGERKRYRPYIESFKTIPSHLDAGIETAMDSIWDVLQLVPRLYAKQFHRQITREELKKITRASLPLIFKIAGFELEVFSEFRANVSLANLEDFRLVGENGELKLDLVASLAEGINIKDLNIILRTGCPALVAKGSDGKSMLFELYDWVERIADEFYFPLFPEK